ncbi:MAG: hypothetical protein J2P48_12395 [Alphaproteobacteria bacterium]|nr:hypothetical protein [Alphaproteobacteria bacterium]
MAGDLDDGNEENHRKLEALSLQDWLRDRPLIEYRLGELAELHEHRMNAF